MEVAGHLLELWVVLVTKEWSSFITKFQDWKTLNIVVCKCFRIGPFAMGQLF